MNNNSRSKTELKSKLGKRKKNEESIEDENDNQMQSNSKIQKKKQGSDRKRKRDQSESKSSISKDADLDDQQEGDDEEGSGIDDEDEDDEYDDEEEEDDEMNDFIADDEEVEEELVKQLEDERRQSRGDRKKRKRKSEKTHILPDEEDLELILQNTGVEIQRKRKKLRKNIDQEIESQKSDTDQRQSNPDYAQNRYKKTRSPGDQDSPDRQEEQIDTSLQRQRQQMRLQRDKIYPEQNIDNRIDPDRAAAARMIFEDREVLKDRMLKAQKQREDATKQDQRGQLEELFDGDEIDDQFATRNDKAIADKDIPEMLQIKIADRLQENFPNIEKDIANEVDWILHRIVDDTKRDNLLHYEDQVKTKIAQIIKYFRCDYMDIPYISKYRKFEFAKYLNEQDIWTIYNLDLEYGKFQQQLGQMKATLIKLANIDPRLSDLVNSISKVKNLQQLNNYSPLIKFLKSYYHKELQTLNEDKSKKLPFKSDNVQSYRNGKIDELASRLFLDPMLFIENLMNNSIIHELKCNKTGLDVISEPYIRPDFLIKQALQCAIKYQATALSVQPYLRAQAKKHLYLIGHLTTEPTEQGKKDLDPFHPSYRVKRITKQPLNDFFNIDSLKDIYLDIIQNEKSGAIKVTIQYDQSQKELFVQNLYEKYRSLDADNYHKQIQDESIRMMAYEILIPDLTQEIRDELRQSSESNVIQVCQQTYRDLLMTGPFSCEEFSKTSRDERESGGFPGKSRKPDEDSYAYIPDRPRCTVMGVIIQQLDSINQIVSVAIVDKYGELVGQADLLHLMPPRKFNLQQNPGATDEEDQRYKKAKLQHEEENKEHETDKDKIKEMILKHSVDLIVVGANKLAARQIKKVLSSVAEGLKNYAGFRDDLGDTRKGNKKTHRDYENESRREAFVIWGNLDIPKLFANSHQSKKMFKNQHLILKQAVSLARFEQDPMNEILNLWSFVPSENQTLQLNLHPLQKQINQAKLSDALEEVNIKCVNAVGIDINLLLDHDHMHILLSFVCGFGPRKAKLFIQTLKSRGEKLTQRIKIFELLQQKCLYLSSGFIKIRCNEEERQCDVLDQTRIHPESYLQAHKIAKDLVFKGQEVDMIHSQRAIISVINNPKRLKELDIKQYSLELEKTEQQNMLILVEYIVDELSDPFKDPRDYRTHTKLTITNEDLFYMLIDETNKTFKKGMIVTATVSKVFDNMVLCKLDNGLDATIQKNDLEKTDDRLQNMIQPGHVITGRIHELKFQDENKFGIQLNCKKKDLESHQEYVDKNYVPKEDWINHAFQPDKKAHQQGRFVPRRIAHPSFKNVPSAKAIMELQDKEIGEFLFRPSSLGENNITLTWKFYTGNIVHINIVEHEKPVGASIGSKLSINDEVFENLQEIIERYIMPCNRHVREACNNSKFKACDSQEELERILRDEKSADQSRIPYRITILPNYPQHIVLGYIPKIHLIKEYIKEYVRHMKRQRSPVARVHKTEVIPSNDINRDSQVSREKKDWGSIDKQWTTKSGANSVHSMNEENEANTQYARSTFKQGDHGASRYGGNSVNPGYSEYGNNDNHEQRGRGDRTCFICKEPGHISSDCPQKQQRSFGRGRGGNNRENQTSFGRGQRRQEQPANDQIMEVDEDNQGSKWPQYQSSQSNVNNDTSTGWNVDNATTQVRGSQDESNEQTMGGWGQKTPSRNEQISSSQWQPEPTLPGNDFNEDRGYSPKSQRSQDEGGRGRGRGRGYGRGNGGSGGGGSQCFKCQQTGHMARDCPNPDTRNQGRSRGGCFKCNEEGHMARDCPNADQRDDNRGAGRGRGRGRGRECHKCQQEGHFARECPNDQQNGERPYKRQRRDDGGSARRDDQQEWRTNADNDNNQNQESGGW
ncbi:transcription elongation factor spt6 [Stylonychia lemnae]|uniref:Transcription elongation factor spt6 n=1 Tax=Stylonychia lemnae TaxID=5949 RepID=A0A078BDE6_STYLE|nr:transcription elongation factor spt6 [Stylonychia lemnae]|eukprot:CDW91618.1 transcription elongation factor spt6 [Stylonychia lemnae]